MTVRRGGSPRSFFERLDHAHVLGRVARPRADVSEANLLQQFADRALVVVDAEALDDDLLQVDATPAHDAMNGAVGADLGECDQLVLRQLGRVSLGSNVAESVGAAFVEPMDPITQLWRSMPPIRAACSRFMPSRTAANERGRRLWLACLDPAASRRRSRAE